MIAAARLFEINLPGHRGCRVPVRRLLHVALTGVSDKNVNSGWLIGILIYDQGDIRRYGRGSRTGARGHGWCWLNHTESWVLWHRPESYYPTETWTNVSVVGHLLL